MPQTALILVVSINQRFITVLFLTRFAGLCYTTVILIDFKWIDAIFEIRSQFLGDVKIEDDMTTVVIKNRRKRVT